MASDGNIPGVRQLLLRALFLVSLLLVPQLEARAEDGADVVVRVEVHGRVVSVQAELVIPASQKKVWDVLTDFDNLPRFVTNIATSKVLSRQGNTVRVAQTGTTSFGPLTIEFQSEREITLMPIDGFESRMLSGNMKQYRGSTRLEASGNGTRVVYQAEAVPDTILPPGLGISLIQAETREHYQEIRNEVLRRKEPR